MIVLLLYDTPHTHKHTRICMQHTQIVTIYHNNRSCTVAASQTIRNSSKTDTTHAKKKQNWHNARTSQKVKLTQRTHESKT